jgi:hypothetical protein
MSNTTKGKAVAEACPATDVTNPKVVEAATAPKSRLTRIEDVARFEAQVGKKFVKRDGSTKDCFVPKSIFPEFLPGENEMAETENFVARYYVEQFRNGNGEEPAPTIATILGRPVKTRPLVESFFTDCLKFLETHVELHE